VIVTISADRRSCEVETETGERLTFGLRPATARFESSDGERLQFEIRE
jgi:hypothetical protein